MQDAAELAAYHLAVVSMSVQCSLMPIPEAVMHMPAPASLINPCGIVVNSSTAVQKTATGEISQGCVKKEWITSKHLKLMLVDHIERCRGLSSA